MSLDAIAQIDALIANHKREVDRLEIARSVLLDMVGNPNRVKQAVIEHKNASGGIAVRRIGPPLIEGAAAPAPKASKVAPKKAKKKKYLGRLNDFAVSVLTALRNYDGGATSDTLATAMGIGTGVEDRKRLYNVLYTLKLRGDVGKIDKLFSLTRQGRTTIAEAAMLTAIDANNASAAEPEPEMVAAE